MYRGTHEALPDDRNERVLIYLNGQLVPRAEAKISVFDSGFLIGDGVCLWIAPLAIVKEIATHADQDSGDHRHPAIIPRCNLAGEGQCMLGWRCGFIHQKATESRRDALATSHLVGNGRNMSKGIDV